MSVLTENTVQPMISSLGEPTIASGTTPNGTTTNGVPQTKRRLCLTICTTRKPGLSEEEFGDYLMKIHGPLSKGLLAKYGMIRWSMSHNTAETRKLLPKIYGENFPNMNVESYDCFSQAVFEDVDRVIAMTEDPYYKRYIFKDPPNFADPKNTRVTIGWLEDHIMDGKVVDE